MLIATLVIAADTQERAKWLSTSLGLMILRMRDGLPQDQHTPPAEAAARPHTADEQELIHQQLSSRIIGGPETVRTRVAELIASTQADELMATRLIHDQADRIRSYELLANEIHQMNRANARPPT